MTSRDATFRCATASTLREDPVPGTATNVRAFLLVEHPGPWGVNGLRDARLPDGLGDALAAKAAAARVRPLLVRRPDRSTHPDGMRVFAAFAHPLRPWAQTTVLRDPHELLDLDLAALAAGTSLGLAPYEGALLCVCTHGRHDACCAERGRPVAAALSAARPEETWEVSHIGGDRFAGNMLVLPHGLYYGRLDETSALAVVDAHAAGELELDHLRGRSSFAMPVQFAEIALRRQLGLAGHDAVRLVSRRIADGVTDAVFATGDRQWAVRVRTESGTAPVQLTCRATRDNPVPVHEAVSITPVG
ncbi:sucrase ferredoxin [Aeromicrobium wangtongii]|uniref:Sucrase ferredoxin n=1 Tax=Aeromicrobium wangtongii TaxID=2969247 RepID=A0ABY5ME84_9ACTN|nr:sucrase ferredoxin [Aeromicrobium wangtongii]MCD9197978.1 sucrase ferredoxin [Aeromicrobium wangtongii]UUP15456.1 sucrase ferredoxin [Aeromicrobium wangtongii]